MADATDLIPSPDMYDDWKDWARQIETVLSIGSLSQVGGITYPVMDSLNRVMMDADGISAYSFGVLVVSPDLVQIDTTELVNAAITTDKIANLAVDTAKLAALSVDAAKLANSAVTPTKIANLAVGTAAIAAAAVGTAQIANLAVTSALIGSAAVLEAKIADLAVTNAKIFDLAVQKLTAGTIVTAGIFLGSTRFELNGVTELITIDDDQGAPVTRVKLGKLGAGTTDYGIQIYDAAGALIFGQVTVGADILNAQQDWQDITGTGIPADNATVGATWSSNITSQPADAALLNTLQDWNDVSGTGIPADNADVTSANSQSPSWLSSAVVWASNKITSVNIATYIGTAAIAQAYIANLAVGTAQIINLAVSEAKIGALAVTNAKIGALAVTEAKITNLAVTTIKIDDDAVTVPDSAFNGSLQTLNSSTWTTLVSVTVTAAAGQPIFIMFTGENDHGGGSPSQVDLRLRKTSGTAATLIWVEREPIDKDTMAVSFTTTPGAGTHTYEAQAQLGGGGDTGNMDESSLFAMVVKK